MKVLKKNDDFFYFFVLNFISYLRSFKLIMQQIQFEVFLIKKKKNTLRFSLKSSSFEY